MTGEKGIAYQDAVEICAERHGIRPRGVCEKWKKKLQEAANRYAIEFERARVSRAFQIGKLALIIGLVEASQLEKFGRIARSQKGSRHSYRTSIWNKAHTRFSRKSNPRWSQEEKGQEEVHHEIQPGVQQGC